MTSLSRRAVLLVLSAMIPLTVCSGAIGASPAQPLTLQRADVPRTCSLRLAQVVSNAYVEANRHLTPSQIGTFGRVTGYGNEFLCTATKGVRWITSEAVIFKSAAGAQRYFTMLTTGYLRQVQPLGSYRALATGGVANSAVGFSYRARQLHGGLAEGLYGLEVVRQGRYLATLQASGPVGAWNAALVTSLSRIVVARMKRAH